MRRQLLPAVTFFLVFTVLAGLLYPLLVTGVAQIAFPNAADGSLVHRDGVVVGSRLIGQAVSGPAWFHPRPSAAGGGYDGLSSSASNLGPTNPALLDAVRARIAAYRRENRLASGASVPVDAVTASGSGLDPDISPANARLQARRVARARGISLDDVLMLVERGTRGRTLHFMGEERVNVLELNLALDERS